MTRLNDEIDAGDIPREIEFYFGGENHNFFLMCSQLGLNKDNENFIDFLSSEIGFMNQYTVFCKINRMKQNRQFTPPKHTGIPFHII